MKTVKTIKRVMKNEWVNVGGKEVCLPTRSVEEKIETVQIRYDISFPSDDHYLNRKLKVKKIETIQYKDSQNLKDAVKKK